MYSDYENENQDGYQNEEDDSRNNKSSGGISSFLPSAKVLGIIVVIEVLVFLGILFLKKDDENSNITVVFENNPEYVSINNTKKINFKINDSVYNGDYNDVTFNIDDTTLVAINNGVVTTGNKLGSTNITVLYNTNGKSYSATGRLIVHKGELNTNVSEISVPQGTLILKPSSTFDLANSLKITPQNGYIEKIEYTNANGSILKIDESGLVEGLAVGEDEVTITVNNSVSTRFKVTVVDAQSPLTVGFQDGTNLPKSGNDVQSITFTQPEITKDATGKYQLTLTVNSNYTLTPTVNPTTATDKKLTFDVLDKTILSLTPSADGTSVAITALKAGTTTITVKSSNNVTETLTVIVNKAGNTTPSSPGVCYCNNSGTSCSWNEKKDDMTIKQSQIPNANACNIYAASHGLCFKNSSGKYVFGQYGNTAGYTYVAGAQSPSACDDLNKSNSPSSATLSCGKAVVDGTGTCIFSTTVSPYTLSSASSSDTNIATVSTGGSKVTVSCKAKGSVTIKAKPSNGMAEVSDTFECVDSSGFIVKCPGEVGVGKSVYISSNSSAVTCGSDGNIVTVSNTSDGRCKVTGNEKGTVTISVTSKDNSSLKTSCKITVNSDLVEDAKISCKSDLKYTGQYIIVAECTNCSITTGAKAIGDKNKDHTIKVTATAKSGHLFANGTDRDTINCTIKKQ